MSNVAYISDIQEDRLNDEKEQLPQLKTHYDQSHRIGWFLMRGSPRPSFTLKLLDEIENYIESVKKDMAITKGEKYDYLVVGSDVDGVFNLGGDLELFKTYIQGKNKEGLLSYALKCIDILYQNMNHYNLDLTTVSLIQGDALGGGLEAALSSNVIIAEKGSKMGLPEVLFNLFPGMGAYSLLSRKIGAIAAEKMILSGTIYTAEELFEMGVVDVLAEKGEGEMEVYRYIKKAERTRNTLKCMQKVKSICNPVTYEELAEVAAVWADAVLELNPKDLKMMDRLVKRQNTRTKNL